MGILLNGLFTVTLITHKIVKIVLHYTERCLFRGGFLIKSFFYFLIPIQHTHNFLNTVEFKTFHEFLKCLHNIETKHLFASPWNIFVEFSLLKMWRLWKFVEMHTLLEGTTKRLLVKS